VLAPFVIIDSFVAYFLWIWSQGFFGAFLKTFRKIKFFESSKAQKVPEKVPVKILFHKSSSNTPFPSKKPI
jgi:hypothetical protein